MFIFLKELKCTGGTKVVNSQNTILPSPSGGQILLLIISALTVFTAPFFYTDFSGNELYDDETEFCPGILLNIIFNGIQGLIILLLFIELFQLTAIDNILTIPISCIFALICLGFIFYIILLRSSGKGYEKHINKYQEHHHMYEAQLIFGLCISAFSIAVFFFITSIINTSVSNFILIFFVSIILTGAYFFGIFHFVTSKHHSTLEHKLSQ